MPRSIIKADMNIQYRQATAQDIKDIHFVETHCFTLPWSLESLRNDIQKNEFSIYVVAVMDEKIVGFGGMHVVFDEGHIMNIAVLGEHRKQGIAQGMIKKMFELAPYYVKKYTLEVRVSNSAAIRLYTKFGFKGAGYRPKYYADTGEDALIMWHNISARH